MTLGTKTPPMGMVYERLLIFEKAVIAKLQTLLNKR
jgi:hypothetical protein